VRSCGGIYALRFLTKKGARIMSDYDEIHLHATYASHVDMDEAFCACMRIAIAAGLENVPIGVVTTPGTQSPKPLASSSLADMDF